MKRSQSFNFRVVEATRIDSSVNLTVRQLVWSDLWSFSTFLFSLILISTRVHLLSPFHSSPLVFLSRIRYILWWIAHIPLFSSIHSISVCILLTVFPLIRPLIIIPCIFSQFTPNSSGRAIGNNFPNSFVFIQFVDRINVIINFTMKQGTKS